MNSEELNIEFIGIKDTAYRYAAAMLNDPTEAEDAAQDLYEKLWRRRLFIRQNGFRQLAMTTIRNICLDILRRKQRLRQTTASATPDIVAPSDEKDERTDELMPIITRIIESLPDREREVIHLRDYEGWQYEDIAAVTGASENAVRMALSRARQRVKEELTKIMDYGL